MKFVKIPKRDSSAHGFRKLKQRMHIQSMDKTQAQEKYPESQNIPFWRHVHFPFQTSALESTEQKPQQQGRTWKCAFISPGSVPLILEIRTSSFIPAVILALQNSSAACSNWTSFQKKCMVSLFLTVDVLVWLTNWWIQHSTPDLVPEEVPSLAHGAWEVSLTELPFAHICVH